VEQRECRELIGTAFASRPYPGDDRIAHADARYPDYEGHRVSLFFRGKAWRQVTFGALAHDYRGDPTATIFFMTEDGFCYYLPAFLLMALDPQGGDIADTLVFALTAPEQHKGEDLRRFRARMDRLSTNERAAVICTLRCLAERYDGDGLPDNPARIALKSYWEPS